MTAFGAVLRPRKIQNASGSHKQFAVLRKSISRRNMVYMQAISRN
jgi:hypothetical protein